MPGSRCTVTNPVTPAEPEFGQIPNAGHDSQNASGGDTGGGGGGMCARGARGAAGVTCHWVANSQSVANVLLMCC